MAKKANKFNLNWRDAARALIMAVLGAAFVTLQQLIDTGAELNKGSFKLIGMSAITAGVAYVIKNFFSNSEGTFLGKDKPKIDTDNP
jgi:hypothetical protein